MVHSSFLPLGNDTVNEQDVIQMKSQVRSVGRKATITREELFQATLNLIGPQKSIASLSLREIAREAGIAPNSFYRHFKDIDELAIALIDRSGLVLRRIVRAARLRLRTLARRAVAGHPGRRQRRDHAGNRPGRRISLG